MIERLVDAERALSYGQVDQADAIYRQVAEADPNNAMAVVGLARVALERADDLGAYLLARRALTIDPENDAARRLAVRLEEVLATRGEPVEAPLPAAQRTATPPSASPPFVDIPVDPTPAPAAPPKRSMLDRLRRR